MANKRDIERPKRLQIWGRSLASASPSEPLPNQPKLRAKKLDIERPDSCYRNACSTSRVDHNTMAAYLLVTRPIHFLALLTTIVMLGLHVSTISAHLFRVLTAHPAPPPFPHNSVPADILGWWHLDLRWVSFHLHTSISKNRTQTPKSLIVLHA